MHATSSVLNDRLFAATPNHQLQFLWLEITQHCNLRCRHCYTTSSPSKSHNDIDWLAVATDAYELGCRQIQFIGGEPLTHPRILEYLAGVKALGYPFIEVFTNAALLSDSICDALAACDANVATSFYSTRAAVHDDVTLTQGSFVETLRGIERVIERGIPLRVGIIMAEADDETAEQKMAFLESLGVDREMIRVDGVRPVGRGAKMTPYESREKTLCGACWNGKLAVSYDGNCYPCVFSRDVTVGNIKERSLSEIAAGPALFGFRESYRREVHAAVEAANQCGPVCPPSGPCNPNCSPKCQPPCTPDSCVPVKPHCPPGNGCQPGICTPDLCTPWKGR